MLNRWRRNRERDARIARFNAYLDRLGELLMEQVERQRGRDGRPANCTPGERSPVMLDEIGRRARGESRC